MTPTPDTTAPGTAAPTDGHGQQAPEIDLDPGAAATGAAADVDAAPSDDPTKKRKLGGRFGIAAWLAIAWLVGILGLSLLAPYLPLPDPDESRVDMLDQGPSFSALLGTDSVGHDVFAQTIFGARTSLQVAFMAVIAGVVIGGFLGMISGYYRGRLEAVLIGGFDIMLAFPQLVLALSIVAFLGQSVINVVLALTIVSVPILARITRANTLSWAQREFVLAARTLGAKDTRIMWRELLPNVAPAMASIALLGVAIVIVAEGGLALLGVGVISEYDSWGNLIAVSRNDIDSAPMGVFGPSLAIFLTVLALNYLGDVVRSAFDVRGSAL